MALRQEGALFVQNNKIISLKKAFVFPSSGGCYNSSSETLHNINKILEENHIKLQKEHQAKKSAILLWFVDENNENIGFIKFFNKVNQDGKGKWKEKTFYEETGYRNINSGSASIIENLPLKPNELIGDDKTRTIEELLEHVRHRAYNFYLNNKIPYEVFSHICFLLKGYIDDKEHILLQNGFKYLKSYNKYLSEIVSPFYVSKELNLKEVKVKFNVKSNAKLVDSVIESTNGYINISSKSDKGSATSLTGLYELLCSDEDYKAYFFDSHPDFKNVIEIVCLNDFYEGPIKLAYSYGIISASDSSLLCGLKTAKNMSLETFKAINMSNELINLIRSFKDFSPKDINNLPYKGYEPIYHVISALSKKVCEYINNYSFFDKAIKELLDKFKIVQVNSVIKKIGPEDIQFCKFDIKDPIKNGGRFIADASKNYCCSRIRGKISFKLI